MKNIKVCNVVLIAIALIAANRVAHAQDITWSTAQTITDDSNLIDAADTPGATYVDAFLLNGGPLTADGVVFNAVTGSFTSGSSTSATDGLITLTANSGFFTIYGENGDNEASFGGASTGFQAVLNAGGVFGSGPGTITISAAALTLGDTYEVQIFNFSDLGGDESTLFTSGASSVALADETGQFATGTFTATGNAEVISFSQDAVGSGFTPVIGAINLVEVAAPEPSTDALLMIGCAGLLFLAFRRRLNRLG